MKQLECKFAGTEIYSKSGDTKFILFDFIIEHIKNHTFIGIGFYGDEDNLGWTITSEATHPSDTTIDELVYESAGNYIPIIGWFDDRPDLAETNLGKEELLYNWLTYLIEEDFIPKSF